MKIILTLAVAILAAAVLGPRPGVAGGALPWCVQGTMSGNSVGDCNYATFEQCMRTAWGDGRCERNPRFDGKYFRAGQPAPVDVDPRRIPARTRPWWQW
jgi:uncharacterized protein DUF3551